MDENTFLAVLYDALIALAGTDGTFHSDSGREFPSDEEKPDTWRNALGWQWTLHGGRQHWWLEIRDDRPPVNGRPYLLDPRGDYEFYHLAQEAPHFSDWASPQDGPVFHFVSMLLTHMDEKLVGQTEAWRAYENGAALANPP